MPQRYTAEEQRNLYQELRSACEDLGIEFNGYQKHEATGQRIIVVTPPDGAAHYKLLQEFEHLHYCYDLIGEMPIVIPLENGKVSIGWQL